jgi:uncharacterized protein (TIGR02145 family)
MKKRYQAFSMVELLVTVSIIAMVSVLLSVSFSNAQRSARDSRRVTDVLKMQQALELYHRDEGFYPNNVVFGEPLVSSTTGKVYLDKMPFNQIPRTDGECPDQEYTYNLISPQEYALSFCLSSRTEKLNSGFNTAYSMGIRNDCSLNCSVRECGDDGCGGSCGACSGPETCGAIAPGMCGCIAESDSSFCARLNVSCGSLSDIDNCGQARTVSSCGSCTGDTTCSSGTCQFACGANSVTDVRDGQVYPTVQIGSQCWMTKNMNVGSMVASSTVQSNNSVIEKHCYDDVSANCMTDGGLYQWAEAVQYMNGAANSSNWNPLPTGNVQGICPSGWHIPSDNEENELVQYLKDGTSTCDANRSGTWDCAGAGTKLRVGGSSGFNALLPGYKLSGANYVNRNQFVFFLTTSLSGTSADWNFEVGSGLSTVRRLVHSRHNSCSVRCLKD